MMYDDRMIASLRLNPEYRKTKWIRNNFSSVKSIVNNPISEGDNSFDAIIDTLSILLPAQINVFVKLLRPLVKFSFITHEVVKCRSIIIETLLNRQHPPERSSEIIEGAISVTRKHWLKYSFSKVFILKRVSLAYLTEPTNRMAIGICSSESDNAKDMHINRLVHDVKTIFDTALLELYKRGDPVNYVSRFTGGRLTPEENGDHRHIDCIVNNSDHPTDSLDE